VDKKTRRPDAQAVSGARNADSRPVHAQARVLGISTGRTTQLIAGDRLEKPRPGCGAGDGETAARIDLAHGLGFIGSRAYRDLNLIREMRNDVAHDPGPRSFNDDDIAGRSRALFREGAHREDHSPRRRFTRVVISLVAVLHWQILIARRAHPGPELEVASRGPLDSLPRFQEWVAKGNPDAALKAIAEDVFERYVVDLLLEPSTGRTEIPSTRKVAGRRDRTVTATKGRQRTSLKGGNLDGLLPGRKNTK
jgi:hypothetical protein